VTLLVNPEQAKMLVEYDHTGVIHADLVYRGDSKTAQKFLDAQDLYFELLAETEKEPSKTEKPEKENGSIDNLIQDANDIIWGNADEKDANKGGDT
jgi:pilus assembly protein CpaB